MTPDSFIPVNEPLLQGNEEKYLAECIQTGWISSEGPFVKQFEQRFAALVERQHGIAVSNGTAALDAAIEALGIGEGDEVILPGFTIISCVGQIIRSGAIPVVVDSDPDTWNMDVTALESKITAKTKAIMMVHIYGLTVDIAPVLALAKKYNLKIIEDAAEAHGQTYKGKPCGGFGDISTFSFYSNKHITTGEGGMIVTNDARLAEQCRQLRNLCFEARRRFVHKRLGWNMRMTNMQAALGLAQLEKIDFFTDKKRGMGAIYTDLLQNIDGIQLPLTQTDYCRNTYWVYGIVLDKDHELSATDVMQKLNARGIGTRPFFCPMHQQPVLRDMDYFSEECLPVAEHLYKKGFYIPSGMALTEKQIMDVGNTVKEILC